MDFLKELGKRTLVLDGSYGTSVQRSGAEFNAVEEVNISHPEVVKKIQQSYLDAGADILMTNTYGGSRIKLEQHGLGDKVGEFNKAAVKIAREVAGNKAFVMGDIGPCGQYIEPLGNVSFDGAVEAYAEQASALKETDLILIETMSDLKDAKAALLGVRSVYDKPVFVSFTFEEGGRTPTGTDVKTAAAVFDRLECDGLASNCSAGPEQMIEYAKTFARITDKPLMFHPNAGIPKLVGRKTVFPMNAEDFGKWAEKFYALGANIMGGCCGTFAEHISAVAKVFKGKPPIPRKKVKKITRLCSRTKTLDFDRPLVLGESINPTNKPNLTEEIKGGKTSIIRQFAIDEAHAGADVLDVATSIPQQADNSFLAKAVRVVENSCDLPVSLDDVNPAHLEPALRECAGKPLINSVNGKKENLEAVLPLAKKYGAAVIALAFDEKGIPKTVEERVGIAEKIIKAAETHGIPREDVIVDCLVSTIAAEKENARITLEAVKQVKGKFGVKTVLGVSNISSGLPNRREINFRFLVQALINGLDLAIVDPFDSAMVSAISNASNLEGGMDLDKFLDEATKIEKKSVEKDKPLNEQLRQGIIFGVEKDIEPIVEKALAEMEPLAVNDALISGLEEVGRLFSEKKLFLPSLMLSAETMKYAFALIKEKFAAGAGGKPRGKVVFATVRHDVHDIGKNIVVSLLESHGFEVKDLGKDVPAEEIVRVASEYKPDMVCLSTLMTTTMPEMGKVKQELDKAGLKIPLMVGGAVVNEEFAGKLEAGYAKDAVGAVAKLEKVFRK